VTCRIVILSLFVLLLGSCRSRGEPPPVLGSIAGFALTNQAGRPVTAESLRGEVWVAAFMFTRCPTICPRITRRMQELQTAAKREEARVRLVSFSVDPEYDTPEVLRSYALRFELDLTNWSLLTGDFDVIQRAAEGSFKQALEGKADAGAEHYGLMHGSHFVLVDPELRIRGFYRSSDGDVVSRLVNDIERFDAD
jgi:protein SCO1/2